jgi:small subunit ribosomal protein S18
MQQDFFSSNNIKYADYKDVAILKQFLDQSGRLMSRKKTKLSAKNQKKVSLAVKRSRLMALLPFVAE